MDKDNNMSEILVFENTPSLPPIQANNEISQIVVNNQVNINLINNQINDHHSIEQSTTMIYT